MWKPVIVGVDNSEASAHAANAGWSIAQAAGAECRFIHAIRDQWAAVRDLATATAATIGGSPHYLPLPPQVSPGDLEHAAMRITVNLPEFVRDRVELIEGRASSVLREACEAHEASLLVVGGKHHSALGRVMIGSTAHELFPTSQTPLLVTAGQPSAITRVLAAVDLSQTSAKVLKMASDLAEVCGADLRSVHVAASRPGDVEYAYGLTDHELSQRAEKLAREGLWHRAGLAPDQGVVRTGVPHRAIRDEVEEWGPDLIVVGSHGHGWDGRALLGRTTAHLLNHPPVSVMVVPVT